MVAAIVVLCGTLEVLAWRWEYPGLAELAHSSWLLLVIVATWLATNAPAYLATWLAEPK